MDVMGLFHVPLWLVLFLLAAILLFVYGSHPMKTWKRLGVPGPDAVPFIGNFHQFYNSKTGVRGSIAHWQKQYGKVFGMQYFRKPCLVVADVEILKDVFVKEYNTFHDRFFVADGMFFPDTICKGVFFQRGPDWKRVRRILTATFTSGKLKTLTHHINITARQLADKLCDHARAQTRPKAKATFGAFSLDVIAGIAFSLEINSQKDMNTQFFKNVQSLFNPNSSIRLATALAGVFPTLGYLLKKMNVSIFNPQAVDYFKDYLEKLITERKATTETSKTHDAIQYLIDSEMEENSEISGDKKLSKEEIVSQAITFLIAGYDTTSSALQFTAYFLAHNKSVQEKVVKEIHAVVGDEEEITYEHCQKLTYLECVINETLRMYPPVHWLKRETNRPIILKNYKIPANVGIIVPVYNIGRDPSVFPDPDTFDPDRFMGSACSAGGVSFLPFGFGPKQCIGLRLAMMEIKIALVHVLKKVILEDVTPVNPEFMDFTGILVPSRPFTLTLKLQSH